jgi:uncharacterized protein YaaQ
MSNTPRTDAVADYTSPERMHGLCMAIEVELAKAKAVICERTLERNTLRAEVEKLKNTSHFCAHERSMETCELFEQLTEAEVKVTELQEQANELRDANTNANQMIGANSDELGAIVENQDKKITRLETLITKTAKMRGTAHIEDTQLWADLCDSAKEIKKDE